LAREASELPCAVEVVLHQEPPKNGAAPAERVVVNLVVPLVSQELEIGVDDGDELPVLR